MKPDPALYPGAPVGTIGTGRTGADVDADVAKARALEPLAKEISDYVRAKLPPDTDFGVFIVRKPNGTPGDTGDVLALTSDRERMARQVAGWVLQTIKPARGTKSITVDADGRVSVGVGVAEPHELLANVDVMPRKRAGKRRR